VHDIETSNVLFSVYNDACSSHVASTGDHDNVASIEFDKVDDFVLFEVELYGVVDSNEGVGVADGASVVGNNVRNTSGTKACLANFEKLVLGFFGRDAVDCEATFDIVKEAEVFTRLLDRDDIHETGGVGLISSDLSVDFDQTLFYYDRNFTASESIFQSVTKEDGKR